MQIYVAYTAWNTPTTTPVTNTDIALMVSKNGGQTWQTLTNRLNDDNSQTDGFSGAIDTAAENLGRSQYMPAIAVDQATGTLVASWRDARYDVQNARVATFVTTSIDGGNSFSPDVYANPSNTATDTITGNTVVYGPHPDNESSGGTPDGTFGFGTHMGLVAYGGEIIPVWSGNFNDGPSKAIAPGNLDLSIYAQPMVTASGPRIISSTMGPVGQSGDTLNTLTGPDGTPEPNHILVTFDRPVDASTFTPSDVEVFFKGTAANSAFVPLLVTNVAPTVTNAFGATQFEVTFDPTKNPDGTPRGGVLDFTGTYSYLVKPNITDDIRTVSLPPVTQATINRGTGEIDLPIVGGPIGGITESTITVAGFPANQLISSITATVNVTFPVDGDLTIQLISPSGASSLLYENSSDNGQNFQGTTFDDNAGQSIFGGVAPYSGTFSPASPLGALAGQSVDGDYVLEITDSGGANISGTLLSWSISIHSLAPSSGSTLSLGNTMDQNADANLVFKGGNLSIITEDPTVSPYTGLTPGDDYLVPMPAPTVPTTFNLTGDTFPAPPYNQLNLPLIVAGPHIAATTIASAGYQAGSADNLVLNGTTSSIDVHFDRDMNPSTVTPGSVLRIMGPTGAITGPQTYTLTAPNQNQLIPSGTGVPLLSTITVPADNGTFPIAHLAVQLSASLTDDSGLTAFLIAPNGAKIQLFTGIRGNSFTNTVLDDSGITPLAAGTAPYTGVFQPQNSLQAFVQPGGVPMDLAQSVNQNTWTLELLDSQRNIAGTLDSWSLIATPQLSITPNPNGTDPNPADPRTYRINFPTQSLSGTYTVQLASTITSAAGDALDSNLNAGLQVLRGGGNDVATASVIYSAPGLPLSIPTATTNVQGVTTPGQLMSTINVPDNFVIPQTPNGVAGITVALNITGANDPDLGATLVYHLGQASQVIVPLFNFDNLSPVGNSGVNQSGFNNTVFTDLSPTPVQNGGAPFFGTTGFRPQNALLTSSQYTDSAGVVHTTPGFAGQTSGGAWTLIVQDFNPNGTIGKLNSWSMTLQKPLPNTGLGEPVADQGTTSFRIFTMDPTNPLSSDVWTAVGPASIGGGDTGNPEAGVGGASGRIGGLVVDPSDPSGNTVFTGGASGGVWKTTDFLNPNGPTWIPLTDFGPTFSLNIGSIAVFGRNNDPRQSIVFAATGEGDTGSTGVGFMISKDGGATWNLYDSSVNVDSKGNLLPENSPLRDHVFVGDSAFKAIVDPHLTPTGQVIIYAAFSGPTGGIWRSEDTGQTWHLMLSGQATDVAYDMLSGNGAPGGNFQIIYAAIRGQGVFLSPNQGQVWNLMTGTSGNPLIVDPTPNPAANVNPATAPNPNGGFGRIELATPYVPTPTDQNLIYQGWLYAVVMTPGGSLHGLYLTKDFGENWTLVRIPTIGAITQANPTNDINQLDYNIGGGPPGSGFAAQGNYDITLGVSATNPNIAYVGGTADGQSTGFLRVDVTNLWDAHSAVEFDENGIEGGTSLFTGNTGPVRVPRKPGITVYPGFTNLIGNSNAYLGTQYVRNTVDFENNGAGATWIPFDMGGTDQHRIVTMIDPITGLDRIIIGDDQGVFTAVDNNGTFDSGIGTESTASGSRNGNLQLTQFYYGAAQPSNVAAQAAQALFYGGAQDNGAPQSPANLLTTGNIAWTQSVAEAVATGLEFTIGDATGVATDQTGSGDHFLFAWPCCGGQSNEFFLTAQQAGPLIGETNGLLQASNGFPVPDPQWPSTAGSFIGSNPIDGNQAMLSSQFGRIFRTETAEQGTVEWFEIGNPAALDGSYAPALDYGAPDPTSPSGIGNLDNFLYVGTSAGHIFETQNGGGANGNSWTNISNGLDGSTVQEIISDPTRGSHDAYAITTNGVYFNPNTIALANAVTSAAGGGPAVPAFLDWQNITSNLTQFGNVPFGSNGVVEPLLGGGLSTIQADWRYTIPNTPGTIAGPNNPSHPLLYVGGLSGIYSSLDNGKTWSIFPNQSFNGSPVDGGYLPDAKVSSLSMAIGNVDVNTGRAILAPGDPNALLATTYGRGMFAIRLAPVVFPTSVGLSTTLPAPNGSNGGTAANGGPLVTVSQPVFDGLSEQSAFGNKVLLTMYDLTDPRTPRYIGGYDGTPGDATDVAANETDAYGNFAIQMNNAAFTTNGVKTIGIQAVDSSGTKGNMVTFSFTLQAGNLGQPTPPTPPTLALLAADDSSGGLGITNVTMPHFIGVTSQGVSVSLLDANGTVIPVVNPLNPSGPAVNFVTSDPVTGAFTLQPFSPLAAGLVKVQASATNANGTTFSPFVSFTIKTVGPVANVFNGLSPASDSGIVGDNITDVRQPFFVGTTDSNVSGNPLANTEVDLLQVNGDGSTTLLATPPPPPNGSYSVQLPSNLSDGTITLETRVHDVAGNFGPTSKPVTVSIISTLADYNLGGKSDPALFRRTSGAVGTWLIQGVTPVLGIPFGNGGVVPFTGDFNGDGVSDLAYYDPTTSTWVIEDSQGTNLQPGNPPNPPQQIPLGQAGDIPIVGNFSGSGVTEVGIYIPGQGAAPSTWQIEDNTLGIVSFSFGQAGDIPVPGAYDGLGKDELAVYRPSLSEFLIDNLSDPKNPVVETVTIGSPKEVPVPGAYDNIAYFKAGKPEPKTEPAVFDPTTGIMTIAGPTGSYTVQFAKGDIPASGDYDGIGETEPAVFRPSTAQFVVYNPTTQKFETTASGIATDVPVLAPYSYRQALLKATVVPTISLAQADDSSHGLNITNVTRPHLIGTTDPNAQVDLINTQTGTVLATTTADSNGNYSVAPTVNLIDGAYSFQTRAYGFGNDKGLLSPVLKVTIQTSLQVLSVSPVTSTYTSLPNGQIVVTFNHPLAGLLPNDATGGGFAKNPFAVYLAPRGPDGAFLAPSGLDTGSTPIHATLIYNVNSNGTSTITLIPREPLSTDVYLIAANNSLRDLAGNPLLNGSAVPGNFYKTFELKTSPSSFAKLQVMSVTTSHASVVIYANQNTNPNPIQQPDTIAINFSKPVDFLTINSNTVQLLGPGNTVINTAVAYSPTTNAAYLTPLATLSPNTTYTVQVAASVSDDQGFPNPDAPLSLGKTFATTFKVNSAGPGAGSSPLQVVSNNGQLAVTPGAGNRTSPFGYASVPFTEPLDMTSVHRFSVMLTLQAGGVNNNAFDAGDAALNAKLAFNPNTNTLILVPTVLLGNGTYLYTINTVKATNGDSLGSTPIYVRFTVSSPSPSTVHQQSQAAADIAIASLATTGTSSGAVTPAIATNPVSNGATAPGRQRPAQSATAHDHAIHHGFNIRSFLSSRRGQASTSDFERLAAERARGH